MAYCQTRWEVRGKKYPLWSDNPKICFSKGLIPVHLLRPQDIKSDIDNWVNQAVEHRMPNEKDENFAVKYQSYFKTRESLDKKITMLRERVTHYNLPYLSLPSTTPKEIALRVFINMNTNTKPLSLYDVIVAEIESVKGKSLHDLQADLDLESPRIKDYFSLDQLILATSALLQNKLPNGTGMLEMDKSLMVDNWDIMKDGLSKMTVFLTNEGIYNRRILPTNAVLAVIAALYSQIPENLDERGKCEILLKKYLWSAFFTDRYENSAATRAFRDFTGLRRIINKELNDRGELYIEEDIPVLNRVQFPLATIEELLQVGWPKRENIRGRALMCIASNLGAYDFADGKKLDKENIEHRDYHHIFPKTLFGDLDIVPDKALNCAIISASTNRSIGSKHPLEYIKDRYQVFKEDEIKFRLDSHLIPIQPLFDLATLKEIDTTYLQREYESFIRQRANLFILAAEILCEGKYISTDLVLREGQEVTPELRELDEEVSKIELATRTLINNRLSLVEHKNLQEIIPFRIIEGAIDKYKSWLRKNPGQPEEIPIGLKTALNNLSLSEYKDIILMKQNWPHFESVFNAQGNVTNRYTQLGTLRNKIRHDNMVTKIEQKDGEAAIEWFNIALMDYMT